MCGGMLPRVTRRSGGGGRGVGGLGEQCGSERVQLCAGGHLRVGDRRSLQGGSLRVAESQVLAFVGLDEPAFGPFAEECLAEVENFAQISF